VEAPSRLALHARAAQQHGAGWKGLGCLGLVWCGTDTVGSHLLMTSVHFTQKGMPLGVIAGKLTV